MEQDNRINRRTVLKTTALAATGLTLAGCDETLTRSNPARLQFDNADF